jgi:membrane protein
LRDALFWDIATSVQFTIGKSLIGRYLGRSAIASGYCAAGGLNLLALWVYYLRQTFLLGAEFTRVYAHHHGSSDE